MSLCKGCPRKMFLKIQNGLNAESRPRPQELLVLPRPLIDPLPLHAPCRFSWMHPSPSSWSARIERRQVGNVSEVVAHLGRRALIRTCLNQSFKALRVVLDFRVDRCFEAFKAESGWVEGVCGFCWCTVQRFGCSVLMFVSDRPPHASVGCEVFIQSK